LVVRTIDKVLEWYLGILEIRKRRLELKELGAPVAEVNAIKIHERDLLNKEIQGLAKTLMKEADLKVDANRRNELETHLTISIRRIVRFVDKGGTVEVDSTPREEPDEPIPPAEDEATPETTAEYKKSQKEFARVSSEIERVTNIVNAGAALRRLPERPEPILQLTEGETGDDSSESGKPPKKKT
jgi:ribosomal protein S20